jgi:hypothetical protein
MLDNTFVDDQSIALSKQKVDLRERLKQLSDLGSLQLNHMGKKLEAITGGTYDGSRKVCKVLDNTLGALLSDKKSGMAELYFSNGVVIGYRVIGSDSKKCDLWLID